MSEICLIYSTFPKRDEALSVAAALLEKHLVACANVYDGVTSLYRWEGVVKQEPEAVLIAKTVRSRLQEASEEIKRLHSNSIPCIVAWPIAGGYPPFLQWVMDETKG